MTATTTSQEAAAFIALANERGFKVDAKRGMVTLRGTFAPGDRSAFVAFDMDAPSVLARLPITEPGSTWGTDGGSVGGHAALTSGNFYLNRSGVSVRFTNALAKIIGM